MAGHLASRHLIHPSSHHPTLSEQREYPLFSSSGSVMAETKVPEIENPRRVLAVALEGASDHLSKVIKGESTFPGPGPWRSPGSFVLLCPGYCLKWDES